MIKTILASAAIMTMAIPAIAQETDEQPPELDDVLEELDAMTARHEAFAALRDAWNSGEARMNEEPWIAFQELHGFSQVCVMEATGFGGGGPAPRARIRWDDTSGINIIFYGLEIANDVVQLHDPAEGFRDMGVLTPMTGAPHPNKAIWNRKAGDTREGLEALELLGQLGGIYFKEDDLTDNRTGVVYTGSADFADALDQFSICVNVATSVNEFVDDAMKPPPVR
jgi:hypothetical protein